MAERDRLLSGYWGNTQSGVRIPPTPLKNADPQRSALYYPIEDAVRAGGQIRKELPNMSIPVLCETIMIFLFGLSWPANIMKSVRSRTAKGKSLPFLLLVEVGYVFGIIGKIVSHTWNLATAFYLINFAMVLADIILWFRNAKLDREREAGR